jgi:uncharacterized membrane protein
LIAIASAGISTYLTIAHYTSPTILACSNAGIVNCARVTTSPQSVVFGVPVALLGLLWSCAMVVLCLPASWRSSSRALAYARLGLASAGIVFVMWLVYAELFVIRAICLWCTAVHVLAFCLFVLVVLYGWPEESEGMSEPTRA